MAFFFKHFPKVQYENQNVQNIFVRFKILDILKNKSALYYTHDIKDGQSAQYIAERYYGDSSLDWVIYIINDIQNPLYDWPLSTTDIHNFIRKKYGSIAAAQETVVRYEHIIQQREILFDGTLVPERVIVVDQTTYNTLSPSERREIDAYTDELMKNDEKRTIKILHKDYLNQFLTEARRIFD